MEKMTKRMAMEAVVNGTVTDEIVEFFKGEIEKLDLANAKRRVKSGEKKSANMVFVNQLVGFLNETPKTASELKGLMADVERPDGKEVNVQWVSSLARTAVANGMAKVMDIKVTGKGTCKGYTVADTEEEGE